MRFVHAWKLYDRIPMQCQSVLPDEGFDKRLVNLSDDTRFTAQFDVYCKPKPQPGKRWGHRVMVVCTCGRDIPFGRMGQHYKVHN